ncbi:uncharacterized protein LOC143287133 [Babylonia areolata]|uniref:uncharacterized protein LOC143287133 n=1 Tax=Babylonia areolata TaxID=304850 RepID=UPI003FD4C316
MTAAVRERTSGRIHKRGVNAGVGGQGQGQPPTPLLNVGSLATRCLPPGPINTAPIGRSRKRSASQMDNASNIKGNFQDSGTTTPMFTGSSSSSSSSNNNNNSVSSNNISSTTTSSTSASLKEPVRKRPRDQQQTTVSITNLGTRLSSNVHTLKPGHIIAWYIDYLIHENEDRTQISRAFTLPVNLFHTDDFYFLDSLRKKIRFPSPKFLSWMQYHLPSLNAGAIDFREGRSGREDGGSLQSAGGSSAQWSQQQDWGWQNKSKRDIIHDVFFYFQHRKAETSDPLRYVRSGTRSKARLVA